MSSFIVDFDEWVGESSTPREYFEHAALSLIAGCLSHRVFINKIQGNLVLPIYPNLYTLLLGPSGNGKSLAVTLALSLLHRTPAHLDIINLFQGKMTAPAMYEQMSPSGRFPQRPFIYVVNDELANDIGMGDYADQFVKSLTRMYFGEPISDATVTRGRVTIPAPYCVNWIACTTRDWLGCLRRDVILGGFFARVVVVEAGYTGLREPIDPVRSPQWSKLNISLAERVQHFLRLRGEITRSPIAAAFERDWREKQPPLIITDPLAPTRRREYDLLLKYGALLAVADGMQEVQLWHFERAAKLVAKASLSIPSIADHISHGDRFALYRELQNFVISKGSMHREALAALAYKKGIFNDELGRLINTWTQAGFVSIVPNGGGAGKVVWNPSE
jgi:hypothetical protein